MDMNIDLKNLNMSDIKDQITKLADKKTLTKIGIIVGSIVLFLIIYYAILNPMVKTRKVKLDDMNLKKQETQQFISEINAMKAKIKKLKPQYQRYSTLFHSKAEVEGLYQSISNFALVNNLSIINLVKGNPAPAGGGDQNQNNQGNDTNAQSGAASYYTIPVDYEIRGTFLGYLKFRRALSKSMKVINFDSEEIKLLNEPRGQVLSKGTISIVGLPDEYN